MAEKGPFICDICGREFKRNCHFVLHQKRIHGIGAADPPKNPNCVSTVTKGIIEQTGETYLDEDNRLAIKCKFCGRSMKGRTAFVNHVTSAHADKLENTTVGLAKILEGQTDVAAMLRSVSEWIMKGSSFDGILPDKVIDYLKREDARIQLALRMIAVLKVHRVLDLNERLDQLDGIFKEKIDNREWREAATPQSVSNLIREVQETIQKDLTFLKEISQLGQINIADVIDKLVSGFGSAKESSISVAMTATGINLPKDSMKRESLRQVLSSLDLEGLMKLSSKEKKEENKKIKTEDSKCL